MLSKHQYHIKYTGNAPDQNAPLNLTQKDTVLIDMMDYGMIKSGLFVTISNI